MRNPGFAAAYSHAREIQMHTWADEIVLIADDATLDTVTKRTPQGREYEAPDQEHIARSRLRIDTRKFLMAKVLPAMYGDRSTVEVEHSGAMTVGHELTDKEYMRRLATLLAEGAAAQPVTLEHGPSPEPSA